jgi:hypothetical protein
MSIELLDRVRNQGYPTFQELFNAGHVIMDELDRYVEIWEQGAFADRRSLQDALGFEAHAFTDWRHPASRVMKDYQDKQDFLSGKTAWNPFSAQIPFDTPVLARLKNWATPLVVTRLTRQPALLFRVGYDGRGVAGGYGVSDVHRWSRLPE